MTTNPKYTSPHLLKSTPLRSGDTIAVISPAGPPDKKRFQAGLRELRRWGYEVATGKYADHKHAYFSGNDDERLEDLIWAFSDPSIKAIICSRGGYGSGRLLSRIPYDLVTANPKFFVGFSDVTALSWAIFAKTGLITFSGPTIGEIGDGLPEIALRTFQALIGPREPPDPLWNESLQPLKPGSAAGPLFPGCLSMIVTLLGTPYMPDLSGAILLIEDVGEKPYRIDRMLTHLKNAGILEQISALLVGTMQDCWPKKNRGHHLTLEEILLHLTASHPIPIYTGIPYGHHPDRLTLPIGARAEITEAGGLRLLEDPLVRG